ncbi:uncharacterized protein LOC126908888 [Daktulosphaira vitifoliae]|uniref:uncharacterized protein LOC126908888 n=1 Tax=Daktulosphaira vitifoliae TaxID=58002 RepID=UPI0021A9D7E3|nr:uncharacterized protein LOC126908888 [Daktulosphaira vitifoliae]
MLPKLFYSIFYTFWILTTKCFVSCKIRPKTYEKYLSGVMDHIKEQVGWDFIQNLDIKNDSSTWLRFNAKDILCKESNLTLSKKFDAIINVLNYMYAEVIKTFIDHIRAIANRCQEYYNLIQGDNLLSCTVLLQSAVENSKNMFEQLYNVMNYLSNIDFKLLANKKKSFSVPIVNEIYTFVEFSLLKSQQNTQIFIDLNDPNTIKDSYKVILDVNNFIEGKGHETYQKINVKNSLVVNNHKPKCLLEENLEDYKALHYKHIELSNYLSEWLNVYYVEISTNFYKNLGFEQVLDLNEESTFKPPVHLYENISQSEKIKQLNSITNESGWKSLKNINIVFNDQVIGVDRILRHPVDKLNFHCKKQHILRLIKCIYTEILFKYSKYVKFILNFCERLKSCYVIFINMVTQIFDAVHKSTKMFEVMYKALASLNELIGEYFYDNVNSNLKCFCSLISKLLKEINSGKYSLDVLDSKGDISKQRVDHARIYVQNFSEFLKSSKFRYSLHTTHEKQCPLRNLVLNIDIPWSINPINFSSACDKLIVFSKNFIKVYYEELGLNKLN